MKYINKDDLVIVVQERLLDESCVNSQNLPDEEMLNRIELQVIDLVISYISARYDTAQVFGDTVIRNGLLVQVISMIVVYRIVKRNAARKVPDDFIELYKQAISMLEKMQQGAMMLIDIPLATEPNKTSILYGNTTNKNFFI